MKILSDVYLCALFGDQLVQRLQFSGVQSSTTVDVYENFNAKSCGLISENLNQRVDQLGIGANRLKLVQLLTLNLKLTLAVRRFSMREVTTVGRSDACSVLPTKLCDLSSNSQKV